MTYINTCFINILTQIFKRIKVSYLHLYFLDRRYKNCLTLAEHSFACLEGTSGFQGLKQISFQLFLVVITASSLFWPLCWWLLAL